MSPVERPQALTSFVRRLFQSAHWLHGTLALFVLLAILNLFVTRVAPYLSDNDWPDKDEVAFLRTAVEVSERWRGPLGLPGALLRGEYLEANRHPFYIALLATFARRSLVTFDQARVMNLWITVLGLACIFLLVWYLHGWLAAGIVTAGTALSRPFLQHVAIVGAEPALVIWTTLAFLCLYAGLRRPACLAWGLVFTGLAYLTKASALLLVPPLVVALLCERPRQMLRSRALWVGIAMALVINGPLLVRNARVYGSPLYNTNAAVFWLDYWDQVYLPDFPSGDYSALRYVREHTPLQMWQRLRDGTVKQAEFLAEALGAPFHPKRADSIRWGTPILLLALVGVVLVGSRSQRIFAGLTYALSLTLYGWYMWIAPSPRFIMPLLPATILFAWQALVLGSRLAMNRRAALFKPAACPACPGGQARENASKRVRHAEPSLRGEASPPLRGWKFLARRLARNDVVGTIFRTATRPGCRPAFRWAKMPGAVIFKAGWPLAVVMAVNVVLAVFLIAQVGAAHPPPAREPDAVVALRRWVEIHLPPGSRFLLQPVDLFDFDWYTRLPGSPVRTPPYVSWPDLEAFLLREGVDWIVLTPHLYERRPGLFDDFIAYDRREGFLFARGISGWRLVTYGGRGPASYLVYQRDGLPDHDDMLLAPQVVSRFTVPDRIPYPLQRDFGGLVKLHGYDLSGLTVRPGTSLTVTLFWQREQHTGTSYTVFVHLLDAAETRVWGQRDAIPRDGAYPLPDWLAGEVVVDTYTMDVPAETPPGAYKIEVGLYDAATGQRVSVLAADGSPAGDRVVLPTEMQVEP